MHVERSEIAPLELWGGVECTVNRVGDTYHDQLERSGHARRLGDLTLFADLGIRAMRYPVLWERTAPEGLAAADWSWADERLARLRELGIRPIVGLLHHGSGPPYTNLIDPAFAEKLAEFARATAVRYPWVEAYTPVNEPLTTARFSGLYGHWYPHGRDALTFARALFNQCRATVLAMRAIREINPQARLIQTEDLGKTYSTHALAYQAEFENERRWLTFDLLCGRVDEKHPMWRYLRWAGLAEDELRWFSANPCPPDIIGINHYLTSERFLDERLERYPVCTHGGNDRQSYADVEAVRVLAEGLAGARLLLREAWERYRRPLAVTEVHLGCTREEQLRWLIEVWAAAHELRATGADIRAVTAWALVGSYDWTSLLTCARGHYESGVFDARTPHPRPTALAHTLRLLAAGREPDHPVLDAPGWWRRLDRLLYLPEQHRRNALPVTGEQWTKKGGRSRILLITGAMGTLGRAFARICHARAIPYRVLTRAEMDIADAASVAAALRRYEPWAMVNAAGFVRVDEAEREVDACLRENARGPATLAAACAERGVALLTFSSDLVFDGNAQRPYLESDTPQPLNVYGRSKMEAETHVLAVLPAALVVRTSAFFGPWDEYNFVTSALRKLAAGERFAAATDMVVSPTYVPDLVHTSLDLLIDGERGLWHLVNQGALTWAELARLVARCAGLEPNLIDDYPTHALKLTAPRPSYSALASERGTLLPPLEDALARYLRECEVSFQSQPAPTYEVASSHVSLDLRQAQLAMASMKS
jgi:dTDP-4-dehydrorhamnose reductase